MRDRRRSTLRRRWRKTFAVLVLLSLMSALVAFAVVDRLVSEFSSAARAVDRKAAVSSQLRPALDTEIQAAHSLLDRGVEFRQPFLDSDAAVLRLFDEAEATFDQPAELAAIHQARAEWNATVGFLRPIVADPLRTTDALAALGPDNPVHARIVDNSRGVSAAMAELDGASHRELTHQLELGTDAERSLLIVLALAAAASALFTLHVGRRMRREIVIPVQRLRDSSMRFASGQLDHRVAVGRSDELGDLAVSFNAMAEAISAKQQQLTVQAFSDSLTGLPNRASFHRAINVATVSTTAAEVLPACVMFIDLDDFKLVNDGMGHDAGDDLLRQVALRLQTVVRATDVLARLGGDEFAVLLPAPSDERRALHVAERMLSMLAEPFLIEGVPVGIGASIGIAMRSGDSNAAEVLLRQADVAMYAAKAAGKHRCEVYDTSTHGALLDRMVSRATLGDAVANGELRLAYQPIVDLHSGSIVGIEALVRWEHPTRGLLLPGEFIPLAEETGRIIPIGQWVLATACHEVAAWRKRNPTLTELWVSVNLSGPEIYAPDLVDNLHSVLESSGLPAGNLVLEVTESVLLPDPDAAAVTLRALKALDVRIALDDFGSGFSSMGYLDVLPFDVLKIDRQLISGGGTQGHRPAVLESIITLGEALGLQVIAEGIEDPTQLETLRRLGCATGQGYLLARPATPVGVFDLLCAGPLVIDVDHNAPPALVEPDTRLAVL